MSACDEAYLLIFQLLEDIAYNNFVLQAQQLCYSFGYPPLHHLPVHLVEVDLQIVLLWKLERLQQLGVLAAESSGSFIAISRMSSVHESTSLLLWRMMAQDLLRETPV